MHSVNALKSRKNPEFRVNDWIMDSGAFSQINAHGKFTLSNEAYMDQILRFMGQGTLRAAVCQDWMCEPFMLEKTGKTVQEHQELTVTSFCTLSEWSLVPILPVLQGFTPDDYCRHLAMYGEGLVEGAWVGVGSVCKRNGNPDAIEDVLLAIKSCRPDLRLHGFGLKIQALERGTVRQLLESADSMAWSFAHRMEMGNGHDPRRALEYAAKVQSIIDQPVFVQEQLFKWWKE